MVIGKFSLSLTDKIDHIQISYYLMSNFTRILNTILQKFYLKALFSCYVQIYNYKITELNSPVVLLHKHLDSKYTEFIPKKKTHIFFQMTFVPRRRSWIQIFGIISNKQYILWLVIINYIDKITKHMSKLILFWSQTIIPLSGCSFRQHRILKPGGISI